MLRCALLFIAFAALHASIRATLPRSFRDVIDIPPTLVNIFTGQNLTFPPFPSLPPVLRGLILVPTLDDKTCVAVSPILADSGRAIKTQKLTSITIRISFDVPRIRLQLTLDRKSHGNLILRGRALHIFRRPPALLLHRSPRSVNASVAALKSALAANPAGPTLVGVVDHAAAARAVGLDLPPSSVVVFGNPAIGSQLWRLRPYVGIELPLEILFAGSPLGVTYVAWSASSMLRARFGFDSKVSAVLEMIDAALAKLAGVATGKVYEPATPLFDISSARLLGKGLAVRHGSGDTAQTFKRLVAALKEAAPISIAYKVAHDLSAKKAMLPTGGAVNRVVVFGNAAVGTAVMQRVFTAAIELPVKIGVWDFGAKMGNFSVGYTRPAWIGKRYSVAVPDALRAGLAKFAGVALDA